MIELRRYIAGDAMLVDLRAELAAERAAQAELERWAPQSQAWTLTEAGRVVGVGGLVAGALDGHAVAWTFLGEPSRANRFHIAQACRWALAEHAPKYRRIEARVRCDFPAGAHFLEWLAFRPEGCLRAWGPDGEDYFLFARIS